MKIKSQRFIKVLNDELAERARRMRRLERERREEVYERIPEIRSIDEKARTIAVDMGRKAMHADDRKELMNIANAIIEQQRLKREHLLTANEYPADYLDRQAECKLCGDTGRVGTELCRCVTQLAINTVFEDSGVDPEQSFENFDLELQKDQRDRNAMSRIRDAAQEYADSFPDCEKCDLLYFGKPGVGKTYLLNCIGGRLLKRGYSVLKISAYRLIQMTLDNLKVSAEERPDYLLPDLLIIDDLGTEPMIRNITIETLLAVLCQRQDAHKATAFATNLELTPEPSQGEEADDGQRGDIQSMYGERFSSRLLAPKTVKIQSVRTSNVRMTAKQ